MTYASLGELPPQVRGALDLEDQEAWLQAFNKNVIETKDPRMAFREAWHIAAKGENVRAVSGIANLGIVDKGGERLDQDALVDAINDAIWKGGVTYNDVHSNHPFGDWYDAAVGFENGVKVARVYGAVRKGQPFYDACWNEYIVGGQKAELSVGIMKIDPRIMCENGRCWKQVDNLQIFEVSAVPRGLCPGSRLTAVNFSAKADVRPVARAGEPSMTESVAGASTPAAPPEVADKEDKPLETQPVKAEEPKADPPKADAPDAGSMGALAEGMQKLIGMVSESNSRMDRLEASLAAMKSAPAPPAALAAPPMEEKAAPVAAPPEDQPKGEEKPADAPKEEPKPDAPPAQEESDKGCGCPKKMANKALDIVAANKEARKEAELHGAAAARPEMIVDGVAKTQNVKAESLDDRMRRYASMNSEQLEREGKLKLGMG